MNIKPTLKKYETTKEKQENHIKKLEELNILFKEYNLYLREDSLYDFNDMINFVLEKFETDRDLRLFYAEIFQFIMLDEYQDTNNAQNKIIELILSESVDNDNQISPHTFSFEKEEEKQSLPLVNRKEGEVFS
jgi:DNA helicase-2/ATP-dependent DNA helicase PcrA